MILLPLLVMLLIIFSLVFSSAITGHVQGVANFALSVSSIVRNKRMAIFALVFSSIRGGWAYSRQHILFLRYWPKMVWIYARPISTNVIKFEGGFILPFWKFSKFPQIHQSVSLIPFPSPKNTTIPFIESTKPIPTSSHGVNRYFRKYSTILFFGKHRPIIPRYWPMCQLLTVLGDKHECA